MNPPRRRARTRVAREPERARRVPARRDRHGRVHRNGDRGALILVTGWNRLDPIASLGVAALMLWASWGLLRESSSIFLERSPTYALLLLSYLECNSILLRFS